ncbi:MAG TPA: MotB family protein [Roseiarcus sp.]|jgi:chemotaxis protein MotB
MPDHPPEIIIIKRRSSHEEEHHGGAWKIAFADFMTAMMAFFLVLWIINATDKNTKMVIARYFNPMKLEQSSKTPKNIRSDGPAPSVNAPDSKETRPSDSPPEPDSTQTAAANPPPAKTGEKSEQGPGVTQQADPANPKPTMTEGALFDDPYRSLDSIAGPASPDLHVVAEVGQPKEPNDAADPDAFRDPFRPIGRDVPSDSLTAADKPAPRPGSAPTAPPTPSGSPPRTGTAAPVDPKTVNPPPGDAKPTPPTAAAARAEEAKAATPQEAKPVTAPPAAKAATPPPEAKATEAAAQKSLATTAARLERELQLQVAPPGAPHVGPAIDVKATSEGLLISLTDNLKFSMFPLGSAEPQRQVVQAMDAVARILKDQPGPIVVRGHTDGHPYRSKTYDNWRLSSARAQMAYYMLSRAGIPESRFDRVEGDADRHLRDAAHPFAAENRRIEILLKAPAP